MNTPERLEQWPTEKLQPYQNNPRTHSDAQIAQISASIRQFGFTSPILIDSKSGVIAGHGRLLAAKKLQLDRVPVIVLDHLSELQKRAYIIADNKLAENADWNEDLLRIELSALKDSDFEIDTIGFNEEELKLLFAGDEQDGSDASGADDISEPPSEPVTRAGDIWIIGKHRLVCGDCRDGSVVQRLFEGAKANVAVTSPPYASQREYDAASGFKPILPENYSNWFGAVAANIGSVLAADGSYFLNIKEHADEGQRSLYVKDLTLAHVREWGWRFVDEFCWRNTANGVPGGWPNRFKNAWEPIFHFARADKIKFRPEAVSHESEDVVVYSPSNPKAPSGSGLLGCGADKISGLARPSNVIEVKAEGGQGEHSAPFPRALVEFFVKAFTDAGDIAFDPFMGSGTTMAAAHVLGRRGYGIEISPRLLRRHLASHGGTYRP